MYGYYFQISYSRKTKEQLCEKDNKLAVHGVVFVETRYTILVKQDMKYIKRHDKVLHATTRCDTDMVCCTETKYST